MLKSTSFTNHRRMQLHALAMVFLSTAIVAGIAGCAHFNTTKPEPITVPQVVKMAKDGIPADVMIAKMEASGTVYRLKASQLANLEDEGVPPEVIDYMQRTYLDAVKNDARYEHLRYWDQEGEFGWYGGAPFNWPDYRTDRP